MYMMMMMMMINVSERTGKEVVVSKLEEFSQHITKESPLSTQTLANRNRSVVYYTDTFG